MRTDTNEFSFVLKPSRIEGAGIGIFTTHAIAAGTKLALMPEGGEHRILTADEVPEALRYFCIVNPDGTRLCPVAFNHLWIVWYINHSDEPNVYLDQTENNYFAKRDIKEDEELFTDYNAFNEPENLKDEYYKQD